MDYRGSAFAESWAPSSLQNPSMERCVWFLTFTQCGDRPPRYGRSRCASTPAPPSLRNRRHGTVLARWADLERIDENAVRPPRKAAQGWLLTTPTKTASRRSASYLG